MVVREMEPAGAGADRAERLPARALTAWRASSLLSGVPIVAVLAGVGLLVAGLPVVVRVLLVVVPAAFVAVDVAVVQPLRHRLWRYAIQEEEIDLRRGWPVMRQTAIPMVRVQHVDLQQGPLARRFGLADLRVNTAAGPVKIPSLDLDDANRIRRRIAELARIPDDL